MNDEAKKEPEDKLEETKPEEAKPAEPEEVQPERKGVMRLEVTVTYEDGWSQTMKSSDMIYFRQAGQGLLTPTQSRTVVKAVNTEALDKAMALLDAVRKDVEDTRPSEEQVRQAQAAIAAQAAGADRVARMAPQGPQGPMIVPPGNLKQ